MLQNIRPAFYLAIVLVALNGAGVGQESSGASPPGGTAPNLQSAKILSVQTHDEGHAFDWIRGGIAAIPIYDHRPFFDLTIEFEKQIYVVRYEPSTDYFPSAWSPGSSVQARAARGRVYLLRYDGEEVQTTILRKNSVYR